MRRYLLLIASAILAFGGSSAIAAESAPAELFNASYDVTRAYFKSYNELFRQHYAAAHNGRKVSVYQSHAGASKQAMAIVNGLMADTVSLNQASDMLLLSRHNMVSKDWETKYPNHAVPFTSVTVILVRKGNPKHIHDWSDLLRSDVKFVMPNPKSSGTGRYAFLSLYGGIRHSVGDDATKVDAAMKRAMRNVPILANAGHGATNAFVTSQIGDALITLENEAHMAAEQYSPGQFEVIYPDYSVVVEGPVAVVDAVARKKGSEAVADEYIKYMWSDAAQELAASLWLRPASEKVLARYHSRFPDIRAYRAVDEFGPWNRIKKDIFSDGGYFDQVYK